MEETRRRYGDAEDEHALLEKMISIGIKLSAEKDADTLIKMILEESMIITKSDGGSIYIVVEDSNGKKLRFQYTKNNSKTFPFNSFTMPIDETSIAGHSAFTGEPCSFKSMAETEDKIGVKYNDSFDKENDYHTVNMLVIPMKNLEDEAIGVVQLINKKMDYDRKLDFPDDYNAFTLSYTHEDERIIMSLASLTAVLLERNMLHQEVERLLQTLTENLVTALDQRDPAKEGHSMRVAEYAVEFCKAINETTEGAFGDYFFSKSEVKEIYYAALLHDIGKIGITENVLLKYKRLPAEEFEALKNRFLYYKEVLLSKFKDGLLSKDEKKIFKKIDKTLDDLKKINEKGFLTEDDLEELGEISKLEYQDKDGNEKPLISEKELENLSIEEGTLTAEERTIVDKRPEYTFNVLNEITWSQDLKNVPIIAAHNESRAINKFYPDTHGENVTMQTKILAIVDIYDSLTTAERPYKKSFTKDEAISIIEVECENGNADSELLKIFLDKKVFAIHHHEKKDIVKKNL